MQLLGYKSSSVIGWLILPNILRLFFPWPIFIPSIFLYLKMSYLYNAVGIFILCASSLCNYMHPFWLLSTSLANIQAKVKSRHLQTQDFPESPSWSGFGCLYTPMSLGIRWTPKVTSICFWLTQWCRKRPISGSPKICVLKISDLCMSLDISIYTSDKGFTFVMCTNALSHIMSW